jgi:hypothetical protein
VANLTNSYQDRAETAKSLFEILSIVADAHETKKERFGEK